MTEADRVFIIVLCYLVLCVLAFLGGRAIANPSRWDDERFRMRVGEGVGLFIVGLGWLWWNS